MDRLLLDSEATPAIYALAEAGKDLGYDISMSFYRPMIGVPADGC
ncbi:hypothetical protein [Acetobacter aceti]|uniref:Uncharacterized protein n=1 Tax=Acetobacter aceti TaxID=435 RepID=A0A6S6PL56_ACEAC|nr:hypothetical protein [Acetobacter aceti]BCI67395.1 hypothetical protein AAJCM20276_20190 [Acetobacter aceti]